MLDSLQAVITVATATLALGLSYYSIRVSSAQHLEGSRIQARTQLNDIEREIARLVYNSSVPGKTWISLSAADSSDLRLLTVQAIETIRALPSDHVSPIELAQLSRGLLWIWESTLAGRYMDQAVNRVRTSNDVTAQTKSLVLQLSACNMFDLGQTVEARARMKEALAVVSDPYSEDSEVEYGVNLLCIWARYEIGHGDFDEAKSRLHEASDKAKDLAADFRKDRAAANIEATRAWLANQLR